MNDHQGIQLLKYDLNSGRYEPSGAVVDCYTLARSLSLAQFAVLLDQFLNLGGKGFREGEQCGLQLRTTHRTLQRLVVCFALGVIAGIAQQEHTDARNATAIQTAKKLTEMVKADQLPLGPYL